MESSNRSHRCLRRGEVVAQQRHLPFGKVRWNEGALPTDRQYTGQRWDEILGLYDYKARYYAPLLTRFIQPDTLVPQPGDPQSLNRYAYVRNNPLRYNDPTGHRLSECGYDGEECGDADNRNEEQEKANSSASLSASPRQIIVGVNIPQGVAHLEDATDPTEPSVPLVEFFQTLIDFPYCGLRDQSNRQRLRDSHSRAPNMWLTLEYSYGQERVAIQALRIHNSGEYEVASSNVELYTEPLYNRFGPYRVSDNERRGTFIKPGATINVPLFPTTAPTSVGHPLLVPSGLYPWETAHIIVYLGAYPEGIKRVEFVIPGQSASGEPRAIVR